MKRIDVIKINIDEKALNRTPAREEDAEIIIDEPSILYWNNKPFLLFDILKSDPKDIEEILPKIPYKKDQRSGGLKTISTIFGYMPRIPLRQNYASSTSFAVNHPDYHHRIAIRAIEIEELFKKYFPKQYSNQKHWVEANILPNWRMYGTVFTSGIINSNNQLNYHYDAGNMPGSYACMLSFIKGLEGGNLVFPAFNAKIKLLNNSFMLFDNFKCLHGVTPMKFQEGGYRYTAVYYTLKDLKLARSIDEELKRVRQITQQIHRKRAGFVNY